MKIFKHILLFLFVSLFIHNISFAQVSHIPITDYELTYTVWEFVKSDIGTVAKIKLRAGGIIEGYKTYYEAKWGIEDKELLFYDESGQVTARFSSFDKKDGKWTITGQSLISNVTFLLKESSGATGTITTPPKKQPAQQPITLPSYIYAKTLKDVYTESEPIVVEFFNLPGYNQDWITIVEPYASDNTYGEWFYTGGLKSGTLVFNPLPAGNYEVRVYFNWPAGQYNVKSRYRFSVIRR